MDRKKSTLVVAAATLVVGTLAAIPTTQPAYAYPKKVAHDKGKDNGIDKIKGNGNTDTDTIQKCKQFASGFDPTFGDQNCDILSNSTISEAAVTPTTPPTPKTCAECFTSLLTPTQISIITRGGDVETFCAMLEQTPIPIRIFEDILNVAGVSASVQAQLIQCLLNAGITIPSR